MSDDKGSDSRTIEDCIANLERAVARLQQGRCACGQQIIDQPLSWESMIKKPDGTIGKVTHARSSCG
jgi:hypothetical protein